MINTLGLPNLTLPAFVAPMFLVSGTELVTACCKAGLATSFPAANARTNKDLETWLETIRANHRPAHDAPWGINLNTHRLNPRLESDLKLTCQYQAPFVVTALGAPKPVVEAIHGYGGLVLADVSSVYHAQKASQLGVDALILVCAGAGGHTGQLSPIAFLNEVRTFWSGPVILSGAITTGADIASCLALGADYAYLGSRFIACEESLAKPSYRQMLVDSNADDIVCTTAFTGIPNNMLRPSIAQAGIDPDNVPEHERSTLNFKDPHANAKAWRDIWSAGQGIGSISCSPSAADLVRQLSDQYQTAVQEKLKLFQTLAAI